MSSFVARALCHFALRTTPTTVTPDKLPVDHVSACEDGNLAKLQRGNGRWKRLAQQGVSNVSTILITSGLLIHSIELTVDSDGSMMLSLVYLIHMLTDTRS